MIPEAAKVVDVHAVPFDTSKLPLVPGDKELIPEVPLPSNTALAVRVERPVPPSATAKSVIPVIEPPVIATLLALKLIVGLPATPSPLVTVIPVPDSIVLAVAVPAPVRVKIPLVDTLPIADRSASNACTSVPIARPSVDRAAVASASSISVRPNEESVVLAAVPTPV